MMTVRFFVMILFSLPTFFSSCNSVREENKLFHAGPVGSGLSGIFFGLYKDNNYQFCDGDFLDHGCYTGNYSLSGDTITLYDLKKHKRIPSNRFLIRRYQEMDSTYWQWKYPDSRYYWREVRHTDSLRGATGDVLPLDNKGEVVLDGNDYFLIRLDKLKNNR